MEARPNVELDEHGRPLVSDIQVFATKIWLQSLSISVYIGFVAFGLYHHQFLMNSPIVFVASKIFGFCLAMISWIPAILVPGFVFGQFEFPGKVAGLYSSDAFSTAVGLAFLLLPVVAVLGRIFKRVASLPAQSICLVISLIVLIVGLGATIEFIHALRNTAEMIFALSVSGIIFLLIFGKATRLSWE